MNIIKKLTLKYIKLNTKRTLVTILGIVISVAMFTSISLILFSFQDLFLRYFYEDTGKYHGHFRDVPYENQEMIDTDPKIEFFMQRLYKGIGIVEGMEQNTFPYSYIQAYDEKAMENLPVNLLKGSLPANSSEILISQYMLSSTDVNFDIGDTITFHMGDFVELEETDVFIPNDLTLTYTISGIADLFSSSVTYPFITYLSQSELTAEDTIDIYVFLHNLDSTSTDYLRDLATSVGIDSYSDLDLHTNVFVISGTTYDTAFNLMLFMLVGILFVIIMIGSVSLIYNSFSISLAERRKQLGMLASIGSTKAQNRSSVFFEGFLVGSVSIPLGIIFGFLGMYITFAVLNPLLENVFEISQSLRLVFSPYIFILTILFSIITIFISAYIPARRAAKITPIDAIRQSADIRLSKRQIKTSPLVNLLFGFEGEIALKNLKRYRKRYRTVVFSLAISIILFLTVSAYGFYLKQSFNLTTTNATHHMELHLSDTRNTKQITQALKGVDSLTDSTVLTQLLGNTAVKKNTNDVLLSERYIELITDSLGEVDEDPHEYFSISSASLIAVDNESFIIWAQELELDANALMNSNELNCIVINKAIIKTQFASTELVPWNLNVNDELWLSCTEYIYGDDETYTSIESDSFPLKVAAISQTAPSFLPYMYYLGAPMQIIVTENTLLNLINMTNNSFEDSETDGVYSIQTILLTSDSPKTLKADLIAVLGEDTIKQMFIYDIQEEITRDHQVLLILSIFTHGFIGLITIICIANIFNNVSTSTALRRKEFAVLKSVGMTPQSFHKMIYFESIFYGIKALLLGLPISFFIMYLIYKNLTSYFYTPFTLPWVNIGIVILSVFIVVVSTMLYSFSKIRNENIVDGLKTDNI
jgi:ABC-type transport system, involved in lipoprotein release, permease component